MTWLSLLDNLVRWLVVPSVAGARVLTMEHILRHAQPLIPSPFPACGERELMHNLLD
jgi:hypothetical protein